MMPKPNIQRRWTVVGFLGWIGVAIVAIHRSRAELRFPLAGLDFRPVRDAGLALRAGAPVYRVHDFVYPPTAALIGAAVSYVSFHRGEVLFTYLFVLSVAIAVFFMRRTMGTRPWVLAASAVLAALLLEGDLVVSTAFLDNIDLFLLLPLVAIIACWATGRWQAGAILLGVTLLIKPLLLPLLLIPLVTRRWRDAVLATAIGLSSALFIPLLANETSLLTVVQRLFHGSNLVGQNAVYNLSISGLGDWYHIPLVLTLVARVVVVAVLVACLVRTYRVNRNSEVAPNMVGPLAGMVLAGAFLAGPLSEDHYVVLLLPLGLTCLLARRTITNAVVGLAGLFAIYTGRYLHGLGGSSSLVQLRFVIVEVLIFVACSLATWIMALGPRDESQAVGKEGANRDRKNGTVDPVAR
jgi:arabinofuranan 3-O-arabinosyltransferase